MLTTDDVRGVVVDHMYDTPGRAAEEFNRWLAEVKRAAAEKAWAEGHSATDEHGMENCECPNPYQREETE